MVRAEYLPENEHPVEQACLRHLQALGGVLQDDTLYSLQLMIGEFDRRDWHEDFQDDLEYPIADLWYWPPKEAQLLLYGDDEELTMAVSLAQFEALTPHEAGIELIQSMGREMLERIG